MQCIWYVPNVGQLRKRTRDGEEYFAVEVWDDTEQGWTGPFFFELSDPEVPEEWLHRKVVHVAALLGDHHTAQGNIPKIEQALNLLFIELARRAELPVVG